MPPKKMNNQFKRWEIKGGRERTHSIFHKMYLIVTKEVLVPIWDISCGHVQDKTSIVFSTVHFEVYGNPVVEVDPNL